MKITKNDQDTKWANVVDKMTEETCPMQGDHKPRFKKTKKDCNTTLHTTCSKQKLPINNMKAYNGPKKDTVLNTGGSRMKIHSICHQLAFSLIQRSTLIIKNNLIQWLSTQDKKAKKKRNRNWACRMRDRESMHETIKTQEKNKYYFIPSFSKVFNELQASCFNYCSGPGLLEST